MTPKKLTERKKRAAKMLKALNKLLPKEKGTELNYKTPWQLLVAVILAAQCTDKRVNEVTKTLFKEHPTAASFAKLTQVKLEKKIRSTGFYKNKAKNILASANMVVDEFKGKVPKTMDELLQLPGVARKTANVVLSNAHGIVEGIAVDTHMRRLAIKFDLTDSTNPIKIEQDLMELLPKKDWFDFHNRLVIYGRYTCIARPHECEDHPLTKIYPKAATTWPKSK